MPKIVSVGTFDPPYSLSQSIASVAARSHFAEGFADIDRLLKAFQNSEIESRNMSVPVEWFMVDHSFRERNDTYIKLAVEFGSEAIGACLKSRDFLTREVECSEIEAIFFVSTTGFATPSIEARIMNRLPFALHTKRVPIWGLGCAGGAAGIARAYEYCTAFPKAKVIVLSLELCSLTFQRKDLSKSNLVGASLFADGAACVMIAGDDTQINGLSSRSCLPAILRHQTTLMPDSESVMGWDIRDEGLYVIFSRDIPAIIRSWLRPNVEEFLNVVGVKMEEITHFVAHPGGRKVLEAYRDALGISEEMTAIPHEVLRSHGNMSSPSVLYVLKEVMNNSVHSGEYGLMTALGPGFSSELLLLQWR